MGYTGGAKDNPTYSDMGDHSESIEIGYDPKATSYSDLLDIFWNSHLPTARPFSRQYMSIIFYHNEEQRRLALDSKRRQEDQLGMPVFTEIVPARAFTQAEDYHQKFYLRKNRSLMHDLKAMYPDEDGLVDSPAAAKINGFLGGYGTRESLRQILPSLGLSEKARQALLKKGQ